MTNVAKFCVNRYNRVGLRRANHTLEDGIAHLKRLSTEHPKVVFSLTDEHDNIILLASNGVATLIRIPE
jgi:hypothetical protein